MAVSFFLAAVILVCAGGSTSATGAAGPQLVGVSSARSAQATSLAIPKPAAAAPGQVLIALLDIRLEGFRPITPPTGWTLVRRDSDQGAGATLSQAVYYHVVGSSEPTSYAWQWPSERSSAGGIVAYAGVDSSRPIDASSGRYTHNSSTVVAPSISTSSANDLVLAFFGSNTRHEITAPSQTSERFDVAAAPAVAAEGADFMPPALGATGDKTATLRQTDSSNIGQLIALRPAAAAAPAPVLESDFSLSLASTSLSGQSGGSASTTVVTQALNGFGGTIQLSATGLPAGATPTFVPAGIAGSGSSALTIALSASTAAGSYPLTITGASGALTHTATLTLNVSAPAANPDFLLSLASSSVSGQSGGSAQTTVSTAALNGFSGTVALSAAGLPAGATATFLPAGIAGSGSSALTIALSASTAAGSYPLTITGAGGGLSHTASLTLSVSAPQPVSALGAMLSAPLAASTGTAFYVSTAGSDANPGTASAPWRTIQRALNDLQAGQIAYVRAGTYSQSIVMRRAGTATAPITVRNFPGEDPVIQPGGTGSMDYPVRITAGAAFFRLSGFVIQKAPLDTTVNVWVSDGQTTQPAAAHDIEVSDNEIRSAVGTGMLVAPNTKNVHVLRNSIHDNGTGTAHQHQGLYVQGQDALVANNLVYSQPHGFGIQVRGEDTAVAANRVMVVDNTSVGNQLAGIVVENTATNTTVVNNVSAFNGTVGIYGYYCCGSSLPGNVAYGNLLYGNADGPTGGGSVIDFSKDNILADPKFVNRVGLDFHLGSGSAAIDRALGPYSKRDDRDGYPRPTGAAPDVGAYEYR
jgi:Disaggregatase related/Protein of unknown function (DUF1565)